MSKVDPYDVLVFLGLGLAGAGVWWLYGPEWMLIGVGGVLFALGLMGAANKARRPDDEA